MKKFISVLLCLIIVFSSLLGAVITSGAEENALYIDCGNKTYKINVGDEFTYTFCMDVSKATKGAKWLKQDSEGYISNIDMTTFYDRDYLSIKYDKKTVKAEVFPILRNASLVYNFDYKEGLIFNASTVDFGLLFNKLDCKVVECKFVAQKPGYTSIKSSITTMCKFTEDLDKIIDRGTQYCDFDTLEVIHSNTPVLTDIENTKDGIKISWYGELEDGEMFQVFYRRATWDKGVWKKFLKTTDLSCIDSSLTPGVEYEYTVRVIDSNGAFVSSYDKDGIGIVWRPTVYLSSVLVRDNKMIISWPAQKGITKYRLFYKRANWDYWKKVADVSDITYTDSGYVNGVTYEYGVSALDDNGNEYMDCEKGSMAVTYYSTPTNIKASAVTQQGKINITWDKVDGISKYQLYYKRIDRDTSWRKLTQVSDNSYTDYNCANDKTYVYTVRCMDDEGNIVSWYNPNGASIHYYKFPDGLTATKYNDSGRIKVTWNKVTGASSYKIYYKREGWTSWKTSGTSTSNVFIDKGCSKGVTYIYTVRACDSKGNLISSYDPNGVKIKYN